MIKKIIVTEIEIQRIKTDEKIVRYVAFKNPGVIVENPDAPYGEIVVYHEPIGDQSCGWEGISAEIRPFNSGFYMEVHTTTPMKRRSRVYPYHQYEQAIRDMIDILTDLKGDRRRYHVIVTYDGVSIGPAQEMTRQQALKYLAETQERYPELEARIEEA